MTSLNKKLLSSLLILTLLPGLLSAASIYKSREPNGVLSFSDQPTKGSVEVTPTSLTHLNTFSVPGSQLPANNTNNTAQTSNKSSYSLTITNPPAEKTFQYSDFSNGPTPATFPVITTISPPITLTDPVKVTLSIYNGSQIDPSQLAQTLDTGVPNNEGAWEFPLANLNTGAQLLVATVTNNQDNRIIGTSAPVQVYFRAPPPQFHALSFAGRG
jgi:hypothetical protein